MKDLYKILGIENTASQEEIKKAYFVMAKKYHPDSADQSEVKKFYEVAEAYQILSNEEERRAYDLTVKTGKIDSILVEEVPSHPTIHKTEVDTDDSSRKKEMYRFRRSIFLRAVIRVMGFSIFMMGIGYILSLILGGVWFMGLISGFSIGFVLGVNKNFDVSSFTHSKKQRLIANIIGWLLMAEGVGYFLWLIVSKFI